MSLLMNDINEAIDDLQEIIVNPVLNTTQHKINNIVDYLKIPGKPSKNYFSNKYNKDLSLGGPYPTPFQLDKYQKHINAALNNLQHKFRNSVIQDLQAGINAEINSLKGYSSDFGNSPFSPNTLDDDVDPEEVKALLNQVNIDLEKLQNKVGNPQIEHFHSRANSMAADLFDFDPYETSFHRKQQQAFDKAKKVPTEDLINHMKRINQEINQLSPYKVDFDGLSTERFNINDEILGYLEARGIHTDIDVVKPPTRPSYLKLATPSELKLHKGRINEEINGLQTLISNPVITASQNKINGIFEQLLNPKKVDPEELRYLRDKINDEINTLQHLADHHPAIDDELVKLNKELNRFLPPVPEVTSNLATIHKSMFRLNDELDQVQLFMRNLEINTNQLNTNMIVDDLLNLPLAEHLSKKYEEKQKELKLAPHPVEIPTSQIKDHQKRINSAFRDLLDSVKDPRLENYQRNISFELNKSIQNNLKGSQRPSTEAIKAQLNNINKEIEDLQRKLGSAVMQDTMPHLQDIMSEIVGELIEAPQGPHTEKEVQRHLKEFNDELDKLKDKLDDDEVVDLVEDAQTKINKEVYAILGRRDTLQLKKSNKKKTLTPISTEELINHRKSINLAVENLLDKIDDPVIEKNKAQINAIIDELMRTALTLRQSKEDISDTLESEKKVNEAILNLFDLFPKSSATPLPNISAPDSDEQLLKEQPITAEDLVSYQEKLNKQYEKILNAKPQLGIYKNRMDFNDILDNLRHVSEKDKYKPKPLFDPSQHLHDLSTKELKQIKRDYTSEMSELQDKIHNNADVQKVHQEFNDLLDGLILAQGGSLEDDMLELDPEYLKARMKSTDEEMEILSELLPGNGVDEIREDFHKILADMIHSIDPSFIDEGIPETLMHAKKSDKLDLKAVEKHRRHLNSDFGELIQKTMDPDIAKTHRDLNHILDDIIASKQAKGLGKRSSGDLLKNLQGLNDGLNELRGTLNKKDLIEFDDIQSDVNDAINRHLKHVGKSSFSSSTSHFPELPNKSPDHAITTEDLIQHQEALNKYFDGLKVKTSTDRVAELQDDFNRKISNLLAHRNVLDLFPADKDSDGVKNLQKANDIVQDLHKNIGPDSDLTRLAALIDDDISRISPGSSKSSVGTISKDPTPKDLEKRRQKLKKYLENVPKELVSPDMKKHFDDLNAWFEIQKEKGRPEILKKVLPQINREIDKLQEGVENQDVAGIQENLNSEIFDLLDLPIDETLMKKIKNRPFRSSRKISARISADLIKSHKKKIDDALDNLPSKYKTKDVQQLKKSLDDKIDYLQNQVGLNKGLFHVEKYNQEIDSLQELIMNGDIDEVVRKLQEEFSRLFKLPPNYWKSVKRSPFSQDTSQNPLTPKELTKHRDKIAKAFENIPVRFKNPHITKLHKTLMNLIKRVREKIAGESQRALEDELGQDIDDLQARIAADIRNLRNKIFAEIQDLESESPLDSMKIDKAQRKIHSEILGVRDKISFEIDKLIGKVRANKNLKHKARHLQSIKNLHGVTSNGITTLLREVDDLLNSLRTKVGLQLRVSQRLTKGSKSRKNKTPKTKLKRSDSSSSTHLMKICMTSSAPNLVSMEAPTATLQTKSCYYVKAGKNLSADPSVFGLSLPNSETRLITPIPSFIEKQKLRDISKVEKCAFNLSSRSAEKLIRELRRINQ
ncbi:unnamed protein product [Allacma fusca]|uniref:Uncharacterized protein n=1 Tax=Allacma fusca TaxID=39272 RepID=A0A8J2LCZ4_9HEXA|nr:unnamed protein product [Allacma fusca]